MSDMGNDPRDVQHLDEMVLLLYIERQLDRAKAAEVSAHTQECAACRTLLRAMERESRLLTRAMLEEDEVLPARLAQFQERARRSLQWIWGVAFGLAATGVYALYTTYIEPWEQQLQQAGFGSTSLLNILIFQGVFWKGWQSVITLVEVVAMLIVGGFALAFFRKRLRRGSTALALVLTGFCAAMSALLMPAPAAAQDMRKGDSVEIRSDETVKGDIFVFAHHARIAGKVDGDVYLFTQEATVGGHVTGDVIAFSQELRIGGTIDGNVRGFSNTVSVTGTVTRNVLTFDDIINLDGPSKIGGSLTAFAHTLHMDGKIGRSVLIFAQQATLSGTVDGEIKAKGDELQIDASAKVGGPVRFEGRNPPDVESGATLASAPVFTRIEHHPEYREGSYFVWQVIWIAAYVLFGLVLFQLMPVFSK